MYKLILKILILFLAIGFTISYGGTNNKPQLQKIFAESFIMSGRSVEPGGAYILAQGPHLRVIQNIPSGLLVKIDTGYVTPIPDTFILKTSRRYVDGARLPVPMCGIYNGVTQYRAILGTRTVQQLTEVPCKNYSLPENIKVDRTLAIDGEYPWGKPPVNPADVEAIKKQRSHYINENTDKRDQISKAQEFYFSPLFPKNIKKGIELIVNDLKQCQSIGTCTLESLWYKSNRLELKSTEQYNQLELVKHGNMQPIEYLLAEDYYIYKEGGNSLFNSKWDDLEKLYNGSHVSILDIYKIIYTPSKLDTNRWKNAFKYHGDSVFIDMPTVQKKILPVALNTHTGTGPPVQYTFWLSTADILGINTEPKQNTLSCVTRSNIPPESLEEKLYNWFCLSPDAQSAFNELKNVQNTSQQSLNQARNEMQKRANQQQSDQLIYQGIGVLSQFSNFFR